MIDHQVVIQLVKAALEGIPAEVPADFPINEYLLFARQQQMEALIITGLLKSGVRLPREVRNLLLQSAMLKKVNKRGSVQEVKLLNWFHRALPAYSSMCQLYPMLRKWPVLLPAMWVVRWGMCCSISADGLSSTCRRTARWTRSP